MGKTLFVSDLKAGTEFVGEQFAVKSFKTGGVTKNGKPYYALELGDKTGSVKGMAWSEYIPYCQNISDGEVAEIDAKVKDGQAGPELTITKITPASSYELSDFIEKSAFDLVAMMKEFDENIKRIRNKHLKSLVNNVFDDEFRGLFQASPAAFTVHHNYESGLIEHTLEMLRLIPSIKASFPKINEDLVIAGVLLHDVGKVKEFEQKTSITITTEGKLLGHIFIGAEFIKSRMPADMPKDLQDEIIHMVLSHHGELEHGSPVKPQTTEAVALNTLDIVSSRINMAYYTIHNPGETSLFSKYHRQLGAELYRSPYLDSLANEDIPF